MTAQSCSTPAGSTGATTKSGRTPTKPRNWASGFRVDPGLDRVGLGRVRGAGVWVGSGRPSCKPG